MSEITEQDLIGCDLPRGAPYAIGNVSRTQFSIARHYGGIKFNDYAYIYNPECDQLVRADVLKWLSKQAKAKAKAARDADKQAAKVAQKEIGL